MRRLYRNYVLIIWWALRSHYIGSMPFVLARNVDRSSGGSFQKSGSPNKLLFDPTWSDRHCKDTNKKDPQSMKTAVYDVVLMRISSKPAHINPRTRFKGAL